MITRTSAVHLPYRCHVEDDYFPVTAHPEMFYSFYTNLPKRIIFHNEMMMDHTFDPFIATVNVIGTSVKAVITFVTGSVSF